MAVIVFENLAEIVGMRNFASAAGMTNITVNQCAMV